MNPRIENLPIDQITVGTRLRKDYGDIAGLAESIADHGLLHPLVVDDDGTLISGERRLRAAKQLGFMEIPVRRWGSLTKEQRQVIELEENLQRKDLTDAERSRKLVKLVEAAAPVVSAQLDKNLSGGRPSKHGASREAIADFIGETPKTIRNAESHVAAVDSYPFLAQPGWRQYHAMEAAETLDKLPEDERPALAALIDQPHFPPRDAIRALQNVAAKPESERKKIIQLSQSNDDRDRSLALTEAVAMPPMPDPRLTRCHRIVRELKDAISDYPSDPEVPMFESLIVQMESVMEAIKERTRNADRAAS